MKLKVKLYDTKLLNSYLAILSTISLICSFVLIVVEVPGDFKLDFGIVMLIALSLIYLVMWLCANMLTEIKLNINNSSFVVKIGDIFKEDGLKVIAFNEYFDTQVDNKIIAENSLNGIYIKSKNSDLNELDALIDTDLHLKEKLISIHDDRLYGKKKKYELGTVLQKDDYLLTAFTKFDDNNRAFLDMNEYISFLLNFWNEIDIIYSGRSVSIPLLGSGITRFKEYNTITEQELLELLIWSFKVSRIKFPYPAKVSIIIHESKKDKINFYKLNQI